MTFENKVSNRKQSFKPQLLLLGSQSEHRTHFILPAHAWRQPYYKYHYYHLKYFAVSDWLQLNPRLILHKLIFS